MRILLTGASGLVGAEVARQAAASGHKIIGLVGRWTGSVPGVSELHSVNLADHAAAVEWVKRSKPEAMINAAAISEPAACDANPTLSHALNVALPLALATAAVEARARFVHISSEQVFDGKNPPYTISTPPHPINLYGRQKLESEQNVLSADPTAAVVRAPLLLGNSLSERRSVHEKLFELWAGGGIARLYANEFRQVCTAGNLATALIELANRSDLRGVFHWAGAAVCSRFKLGQEIAAHFGVPQTLIASVMRASTPEISAKRPADLSLDLAPLNRELRVRPQALSETLSELKVPEVFRAWQKNLPSVQ